MQPHLQTSSSPVLEPNRGFKVWWQLTRPHTLTAAFVPVLLGTALALKHGDIHYGVFLAMLIASLLIQAATNMFNEYYDFKKALIMSTLSVSEAPLCVMELNQKRCSGLPFLFMALPFC